MGVTSTAEKPFRRIWVYSGFIGGSCCSIFSSSVFVDHLFVLLYILFWPL